MTPVRRAWTGLGIGFVALVVFLSLTPNPLEVPGVEGIKLDHLAAYLWLMLWFAQLYRSLAARIGIAMAFAGLGVGLEYAQGLTGYRYFSYADMRDNALGVAVGFALAFTAAGGVMARLETSWQRRRSTA